MKQKLWNQIGMDLIDTLPLTSKGNKYIITLTDYFSKWAEATPLTDKTAASVAEFVYSVSFFVVFLKLLNANHFFCTNR